ncbi:DoxX family protein [uncultured Corynebacterium sp.]|uniref:DoxX family protein n=1 Tax=uncultured Corynebacterium sp. TaxID=159447 RepID=UPI0025F29DA4|nr:DoxX family protein [uncultured Corynebacterium sp.]
MTYPHLPTVVRDVLALIARLGLGAVVLAHGWQKLFDWTIAGTQAGFEGMGAPAPTITAWIAAIVEFVGGILIIAGAFQPIVGIILALQMLGAWIIAHTGAGMFVDNGGPELVIAIGAAALFMAALGSGRFSVDAILASRRTARVATANGRDARDARVRA